MGSGTNLGGNFGNFDADGLNVNHDNDNNGVAGAVVGR
jgi:hypothetical protein